jgi:hypothetical protein
MHNGFAANGSLQIERVNAETTSEARPKKRAVVVQAPFVVVLSLPGFDIRR